MGLADYSAAHRPPKRKIRVWVAAAARSVQPAFMASRRAGYTATGAEITPCG